MSDVQKVIKYFAILLAGLIILAIISFLFQFVSSFLPNSENNVKEFYEEYQNVREIDINSVYSKIVIQSGDKFSVDGNNLNLDFSSTENSGVLKIEEKSKKNWSKNYDGIITITVDDKMLNKLDIEHGAGKLLISDINVKDFELEQGAGKVEINNVKFDNTSIDGGAGEIVINSSDLKNLDMDIGAGRVSIAAYIEGKSKIDCGVGALNINLLGNKDDYQIKVNKGIGNVTIEGIKQSDGSVFGAGYNTLILDGGIGSIKVDFE